MVSGRRNSTPGARRKAWSILPLVGATAGLAWGLLRSGRQPSAGQRGLGPSSGRDSAEIRTLRSSWQDNEQGSPGGDEAHPFGRDAEVPEHIPPRGWWRIAKRTFAKFSENDLMLEAAGITFYALLSLFPALTAMVSIYGLFSDPHSIEKNLDAISAFVPGGGMDIIRQQVERLIQSPKSGLSLGAAFGVLTALWSANQGTKAMFSSLNDVYGEREKRGFLMLSAVSLGFTVGAIILMLVGVALIVVLPLLFEAIGMGQVFDLVISIARWPLALALIIAALAVLFRYGPSRRAARWRWLTWGSVIGALGWIGLSIGFSWYVSSFGNYNKTYGSLGAIIGFMTWIWLSSTVLLVGAQINAEMETQTERDTTIGETKPIGERGAHAADATTEDRRR